MNEKNKKRVMVVIVIVCALIGGFFLTLEWRLKRTKSNNAAPLYVDSALACSAFFSFFCSTASRTVRGLLCASRPVGDR